MKKTTSKATIKPSVKKKATTVPTTYRMPDSTYTTSRKKYLEAWTKMGEDFGKIIGGTLLGFDPDLTYRIPDSYNSENFSPFTVAKILKALSEANIKGYNEGQKHHRDYTYYNYY